MIVFLHIFSWFWQWKNFENRLIFDKAKAYKKIVPIFGPPCRQMWVVMRKRFSMFISYQLHNIYENNAEFLQADALVLVNNLLARKFSFSSSCCCRISTSSHQKDSKVSRCVKSGAGRLHRQPTKFAWFQDRTHNQNDCMFVNNWKPITCYSIDLRIQAYSGPVPLKYGKLATKYPWIYGYFLQCSANFIIVSAWSAAPRGFQREM